jgi:hypothetical protein
MATDLKAKNLLFMLLMLLVVALTATEIVMTATAAVVMIAVNATVEEATMLTIQTDATTVVNLVSLALFFAPFCKY